MKKTIFLIILILFLIISLLSFFWFYETRYFISRADVSQAFFSVDNSYLFTTPLRAKANNQEKIRVTVFVLNNQGVGVMGKQIFIATEPNLTMETIQGQTDSFGKAIFDFSSNKAGEYYLEVKVDDKILPQKAHLSFY